MADFSNNENMNSSKVVKDDSYDELLKKYNALIKICKTVMDDIRTPINFLGDATESIDLDKLDQPEGKDRKTLILLMETCRNLYTVTSDVLDWFNNSKVEVALIKEELNLAIAIEEIVNEYRGEIKSNNNFLVLELEEEVVVSNNKEICSLIIKNALENANKYTQNGQIKVTLQRELNEVVIYIQDTGIGFDNKKFLEKMDNRNPSIAQYMGYRIINDLAEQVGLTYELISEVGVGTTFVLKLPVSE